MNRRATRVPVRTRREFLRDAGLGAALTATVPAFLGRAFFGGEALAQGAGTASGGAGGPIVVVVQQGGGNDLLNTVVPYQGADSAIYYQARPNLAIPREAVLPLEGDLGLHPALGGLRRLWDDGELALVNGVGYPNPNLSHFTSFDYWHTARPNEVAADGWLGRFFDHQCAGLEGGCEPTVGVNFDAPSSLAFLAPGGASGVTVDDPAALRWRDELPFRDREDRSNEAAFRELIAAPPAASDEVLDYTRRTTHNALVGAGLVEDALGGAGAGFPHVAFPETGIGRDLESVAALIAGGLPTSVYYVDQSGYDTHARQGGDENSGGPLAGRHAELLADLDGALAAFVAEMKAQGNWDRVLLFTFSEFGRKVEENASLGTDHGAGSSLFVTGGGVRPGMFGTYPSLAPDRRIKNDSLLYHVDFRRVYRTVLRNWLGVSDAGIAAILPSAPSGSFETLDFV